MVSKEEAGPSLGPLAAAPEEKAMTVRSVLRQHGGPDAERRLQRRQCHPHQVRFKDLEDGRADEGTPVRNTPCASATPMRPGANPARQSWPQAEPRPFSPQPPPHKGCANMAIQTSPGLQRLSWAAPLCSKSACDCVCQGGSGQDMPLWGPPTSLSTRNQPLASSLPQLCPKTRATQCPVRSPPLRCPCPLYSSQEPCLSTSSPSQHKPCAPSLWPSCSPSAPRLGPPTLQTSQPAPQRTSPGVTQWGSPPLHSLAQGSFQGDPLPSSLSLWNSSPWEAAPQLPHSATSRKPPPASAASPESLGSAQVPPPTTCLPPETHQPPCPGPRGLRPPRAQCHNPLPRGCLSPTQAGAVLHIQDLLQLVPMGREPAEEEQHLPAASRDPAQAVGDVQSRLQSLEGVLETSQQTIRVLLGVIQDLEKKEAQQDRCCLPRRGQDVAKCGLCRDCACIIYSVEQDFRQQEGHFRRVLTTLGDRPSGQRGSPRPSSPCQPPRRGRGEEARKDPRRRFCFL